jgi:CheY-like chemotaxis protein
MIPPLDRILLVEDDPDIQMVAGMALETIGGFTLYICGSGHEALEAAPGFAPGLFLFDVMMPEMDGPTTLRKMREIPALAGVPAIFMTARVCPEEIASYRLLGVEEVIPKPFDPMTLAGTVQNIWARIWTSAIRTSA